jgi:hypothetical protein
MRLSPITHALRTGARRPSTAALSTIMGTHSFFRPCARNGSTESAAKKQLYSITEIDRWLTHIASESKTD